MGLPDAAVERGRFPSIAKYEVTEEIGHGGMATVYRAHDPRLARDVAVKVIHRHLRDSQEIAHRFFTEAKAVAKLRHPNIVEVYDVSAPGEDEQYLVVELVRGRTLRKVLQTHGALPPEVGAAMTVELLLALSHAHGAGVVHRDIKPENVMIEHVPPPEDVDADEALADTEESEPARDTSHAPVGERVKVKLTDFGIAKLLDAQGVTSTGQVLGSPAHMAPEQIEGGDVDGRADVFGVGVLFYECLVGHLPFEGNNPAQVLRRVLEGHYASAERERPVVGKAWSAILDRALAHQPEDRYRDPGEMRDAITEELRRLGITDARATIESWLDDPEGYAASHEPGLIARLCELGVSARRRGDAVAAAADYNRALAYAPHDTALMRIVSTMHRNERRLRLARRVAPAIGGAVIAGFVAFFATRAVRSMGSPGEAPDTIPSARASAVAPVRTAPTPPSTAPSAAAAASTSKPVQSAPRPAATPPSAPKEPVTRQLVFLRPTPPFGVKVRVDGGEPADVTDGTRIAVDDKAHVLAFSCANDYCEPQQRAVAAGEKNEEIVPELAIKPAMVLIEGESNATYTIEEMPTVPLRAGVPARVPMTGGRRLIRVVQRPSGIRKEATLSAGHQVQISFALAGEEGEGAAVP